MRIAVDIGGTFTDLVAVDGERQVYRSKSLTTPDDLSRAIEECLKLAGLDVAGAEFFVHGSTVTINAVLERKGARTGLITTQGFRDVYEIGRGNRPEGYNLFFKRPVPLVSRDLRLEVDERLYATGEILTPLDERSAAATIAALKTAGVESVAVCLLHSYANPIHERRTGELLREQFPEAYVSLSHEILREFREYERTSTTVLNAYVGPLVSRYLAALEKMLGAAGFRGTFRVMQSNGGVMSAETAKKMPVTMMESGPVAGVIAAAEIGESLDCRQIISFDMGGTTAKASLIKDFHPEVTSSYYVGGYVTGHPMMLPVVDIVEVGSGGGSIAWIDAAGGVKVGPQSAGAAPGPACYGRGGVEPTVTDANLILGRIDPEYFLGSGIRLQPDKAAQAIVERIGKPLGLVGRRRGARYSHDREFQHVAGGARGLGREGLRSARLRPRSSGGGGPLHAGAIARELSVPRIIIPPMPAHFSALGMLLADLKHDYVQTFCASSPRRTARKSPMRLPRRKNPRSRHLRRRRGRQSDRAPALSRYALPRPGVHRSRARDRGAPHAQRFQRNPFTVRRAASAALRPLGAERAVMMVNLRLTALGRFSDRLAPSAAFRDEDKGERGKRAVTFGDAHRGVVCPIYLRSGLKPGDRLDGPAVVEEMGATILLYPGDKMQVLPFGHLAIDVGS
jgi:N-methylhydantoinase A